MQTQSSGLTPAGKVVITIVVIGLAVLGGWFLLPKGTLGRPKEIDVQQAKQKVDQTSKVADTSGLTAKEYKYVPEETLPAVVGTGDYKWDKNDPTVVFPINVWIGWLPLIAANHGFDANDESLFKQKYGFKVQFKLIDDINTARQAYTSGEAHVLWGTLDMIALMAPGLMESTKTAPRVVQQIDWSNGGDGIVARGNIKTIADLEGKQVVLAQNSPSEYYLNALLIQANIQPRKVRRVYTGDAFQAAKAFASEKTNDACVSWAPDIYKMTDGPNRIPDTTLLSSTGTASKLITDVYAVRADFAKEHPDVVKGLVEGTFSAMEQLDSDKNFEDQACGWLGKGYGIDKEEIKGMLNDAHRTNFAENRQFFLNASNPTNFEHTWNLINFVYGQLGKIKTPVPFDQVMDFSIIKQLASEGKFGSQKDTYSATFKESDWTAVTPEKVPEISSDIRISYAKNAYNPLQHLRKIDPNSGDPVMVNGQEVVLDKYYDPDAPKVIERIATLAAQYDSSLILIVGHVDSSEGAGDPQKLSRQRAESLRLSLIDKYKFSPTKFRATGKGSSEPSDKMTQTTPQRTDASKSAYTAAKRPQARLANLTARRAH